MDEIRLFSYKMTDDSGFAPCPFGGMLTLATCKPMIRNSKRLGDWIAGFTSNELNGDSVGNERLVYLMRVTDKVDYVEYWHNPKYKSRVPNSESKNVLEAIGDNIYKPKVTNPKTPDDFKQMKNKYHKKHNIKRDLSSFNVLVSEEFYYFGSEPLVLSLNLKPKTPKGQTPHGVRTHDIQKVKRFIEYIQSNYQPGIYAHPHKWFKEDTCGWKEDENYIESKRI